MNSAAPAKDKVSPLPEAVAAGSALGAAIASRRWLVGLTLFILDIVAFWGIHQLLVRLNFNEFVAASQAHLFYIPLLVLLPIVYTIGGYDTRSEMRGLAYTSGHLIGVLIGLGVAALAIYTFAAYASYVRPSRGVLLGSFAMFVPVSLAYRWIIGPWVSAHSARKYFLVLGAGAVACDFFKAYQGKPNRQSLVFVDPTEARVGEPLSGPGTPVVEGDACQRLRNLGRNCDGVIVAEGSEGLPVELRDLLVRTHFAHLPVYTLETFYETQWRMVPVHALNPLWALQMGFQFTRDYPYTHIKRGIDILISGLGLILAGPLMLAVALAIYCESGRPVIFRQKRYGRDSRPFTVFKFRTMRPGAERGSPYTVEGDDRITPLGRWLRRVRLDELPQLWNVFRGDMSLIGPRAESADCVARYESTVPSYHLRHMVKPGITGWAQVNYGYGAGEEDALEKLKFDLYYIRHHSLLLDAMIVLRTLYVMIAARGR
ncbi:MAG: sugar transferase [Verrucomicrobia bacterium]|nr:sugar transferase [Verrucomicrobiota bacterium]